MPLKLSDRKKKTQKNIHWEKFRQNIPDDSNLIGRNASGTYAGTCSKIEERITHFFGTSSFRYRKLRKTLVLIEFLKAIKFRWVLDGWKSTGNSVRMWVSKTKGNNKTKCSAFEAHVRNARCRASKGTAVLEVAIIFLSLWSNNSNRYFWRMSLKIKERFSLGGLFTL